MVIFYTRLLIVSVLVLLSLSILNAQQTNNWYFGSAAGWPNTGIRINFTSGTPIVSTCVPMLTEEGSSSISDASGNPILYTDGVTLWDAAVDTVIATGLLGNPSSTQSAIILPKPGSTTQWLLFTSGSVGFNGINYYTVTRETPISTFSISAATNLVSAGIVGEGLCIIGSSKVGSAFWVIARDIDNSIGGVRAWEVSDVGNVNVVAVTSNLSGLDFVNVNFQTRIGSIKSNTCQSKLAFSYLSGSVDITDFDAVNGVVVANTARRITIAGGSGNSGSYGIEFSPNDEYLYLTNLSGGNIYSYMVRSPYTLSTLATLTAGAEAGQLQIAPNGVIYMARKNMNELVGPSYLSSITSANTGGVFNEFALQTNLTSCAGKVGFTFRGLPTFPKTLVVSSFVLSPGDISSCTNETTNTISPFASSSITLNIFPNPTSNMVTISVSNKELSGSGSIVVYNKLGQKIYHSTISASELSAGIIVDLDSIANGCHILEVSTTEGKWIERLVKN